ncbi:MAG: hypothetical protein HRT35_14765 [Algicola sp.]|nr:hypothetical protein [Algicola sp.]
MNIKSIVLGLSLATATMIASLPAHAAVPGSSCSSAKDNASIVAGVYSWTLGKYGYGSTQERVAKRDLDMAMVYVETACQDAD